MDNNEKENPIFMVVSGQMRVGKSWRTENNVLIPYNKIHPTRGVLILDTNNEFSEFPSVDFDILDILKSKEADKKEGTKTLTQSL